MRAYRGVRARTELSASWGKMRDKLPPNYATYFKIIPSRWVWIIRTSEYHFALRILSRWLQIALQKYNKLNTTRWNSSWCGDKGVCWLPQSYQKVNSLPRGDFNRFRVENYNWINRLKRLKKRLNTKEVLCNELKIWSHKMTDIWLSHLGRVLGWPS